MLAVVHREISANFKIGPGSDGLTRISADPSFLMYYVSLHTGDFPLSRVDFASFLVSLLCLCEVSGERGRASTIHANLHLIRTTGARHLWQMSISSRSAGSVSTGAVTGLSVCVCVRERVYYGSGPVDFSLAPRGRLGHKLLSSPPPLRSGTHLSSHAIV